MARTVGQVFNDSDIAAGLNFTMIPCAGGGGPACEQSDVIEACALDATGCVGGCTGEAALKLSKFVGCFEHNFTEGGPGATCVPADAAKCTAYAGIADEHAACMSSSSRKKQVADWGAIETASAKLHFFPTVKIDGKMDGSKAQDPTKLRSELCKAGLAAAC